MMRGVGAKLILLFFGRGMGSVDRGGLGLG
jgi:hypothetical protein